MFYFFNRYHYQSPLVITYQSCHTAKNLTDHVLERSLQTIGMSEVQFAQEYDCEFISQHTLITATKLRMPLPDAVFQYPNEIVLTFMKI